MGGRKSEVEEGGWLAIVVQHSSYSTNNKF